MTRVAVTGGQGFLGWHLRVLAAARGDVDIVALDRATCEDPAALASAIDGLDRVVHLAGSNRGSDEAVAVGNTAPALVLAEALGRCALVPSVAFANSTQSGNGSVYGTSKARAADLLRSAAVRGFDDLRLPNLFGEHGRPFYNSVVATFSRQLAAGERPTIQQDRAIDLLHARDAASALLDGTPAPAGSSTTVSSLLDTLSDFAAVYRNTEIPALPDALSVDLFNTYRSFCSPLSPAPELPKHADQRGALVEAVKVHGGTGQCFFSTSHPGVTRGQHYHLRKVERFVVLEGEAVISLRRKLHSRVIEHHVTGELPMAVDMPTMWVHNITNVGERPLLTLFWANDLFDPAAPDTYPEAV